MKIFILIIGLLTVNIHDIFAEKKLSSSAEISILTCSAGEELYSGFGHTAIRVNDINQDLDLVFNYGTFNFNTPNFYLKFINGKLNYQLSISEYSNFYKSYLRENRSIKEQVLNFTDDQKEVIFKALIANYKPENRYYKYDFFYDNCATRVFYLVLNNSKEPIKINTNTYNENSKTFRECLDYYIYDSKWIRFGLKTILGLPADKIATAEKTTFLPDYLFNVLSNASIKSQNGAAKLIKQTNILLEKEPNTENSNTLSPILFFFIVLICIIIMQLTHKKFKYLNNIVLRVLFLVNGLVGVLILYLWFVTDHSVTANNLNIIWSLPLIFIVAFANWKRILVKIVVRINLIIYSIYLITFFGLPQSLPIESIIIVLTLAIAQLSVLYQHKIKHIEKY